MGWRISKRKHSKPSNSAMVSPTILPLSSTVLSMVAAMTGVKPFGTAITAR